MGIYKRNEIWYMDACKDGTRVRKRLSRDKAVSLQMYHSILVNRDKYNAGLPEDVTVQQLFDEYI